MTERWTIKKVLDWAAQDFAGRKFDSPRLEAELLLSGLLEVERLYLYTNFDRPLTPNELKTFRTAISRRRNGECAAYILGKKEFWSLEFQVSPDVLVPRPETETLVQQALETMENAHSVLDLCTGTGCIAVALAKEQSHILVDATDISPKAVKIAERNVNFHNLSSRVHVFQSDLFSRIASGKTYDRIISNPPYVIGSEIPTLAPEVQGEPSLALDGGGEDGLDIIIKILKQAPKYLNPGGKLFIELDPRQAQTVATELSHQTIGHTGTIIKDLTGRDRVVVWNLP